MWFLSCWNFNMNCTVRRFAFAYSKAVTEWFRWGALCGTTLSNWKLKKKLRTFKIILSRKCICQMLPYLVTAESRAPWFIWLFAVIYSQQMRELNPNQTHTQLPSIQPPGLCVLCALFSLHRTSFVGPSCPWVLRVCLSTATAFVGFRSSHSVLPNWGSRLSF